MSSLSWENTGLGVDVRAAVDSSEERPKKPYVSELVPLCLMLWASSAATYSASSAADVRMLTVASIFGLFVSVVLLLLFWFWKRSIVFLSILFICLGATLGAWGGANMYVGDIELDGKSAEYVFVLESDPQTTSYGMSATASVVVGSRNLKATVYLPQGFELLRGESFRAKTTIKAVSESDTGYGWSAGLQARCTVKSFEARPRGFPLGLIHSLRRDAINKFAEYGGSQAGILQALICGYRNTINDSGDYEDYKTCGLAHIVAVSGAHFAIVVLLSAYFLRLLRIARIPTLAITVLILLSYLVFSGVPISAVRAAFMSLLSMTSFIAKRRGASINALALCVVIFIAQDVHTAVSVSFFLSAASTLGIILFVPLLSSWFSNLHKNVRKYIGEPIALTLSSNVVTLPASAALFSQVSLVAPLANLIASPLFTLACIGGLVCTTLGFIVPPLCGYAIFFASLCTYPLSAVVNVLARVPFASIAVSLPFVASIIASLLLCGLLWYFWPRFSLRMVAYGYVGSILLVFILAFALSYRGDRISMIDVGQGDATVIESCGKKILIDTGKYESSLREGIVRYGLPVFDAVLITHADEDHCGCLTSLASYTYICRVIVAEDALSCPCENCTGLIEDANAATRGDVVGLGAGDSIKLGNFTLDVIWPHEFSDEGGNADSLCIVASLDSNNDGQVDSKTLLCGDAESDQLEKMVDEGSLGDIDVLKVGHHGSKVSLTQDLANVLTPAIAFIGVGANNRYGHPSDEVLSILGSVATQIFRTDQMGYIDMEFYEDRIDVSTEKSKDGPALRKRFLL